MFLALPLIALFTVFGEEEVIPDYDNPYAPILTDKQSYTWTDKIYMTIVAPSWNTDRYLIDTIGDTAGHPIKIAAPDHSLTPYTFVETDVNSGIFKAEVTLTGFAYDVDGDGLDDTAPQTGGTGPTSGYLEIEPDSGVTISFEFADGVVLTKSVDVTWHVGIIEFLRGSDASLLDDSLTVRVIDADMNLNPQTLDTVMVHLYTSSDVAGITVNAVETTSNSGSFIVDVPISEHASSNSNKLYAESGDQVFARYQDYTLPESANAAFDNLSIESSTRVEPLSVLSIDRLESSPVVMSNSFGEPITAPSLPAGIPFQMIGTVTNSDTLAKKTQSQPFVYTFQVKNPDGSVEFLSWFQSEIPSGQSIDISQSWTPKTSGVYTIETFVWQSLDIFSPLSESTSVLVTVN